MGFCVYVVGDMYAKWGFCVYVGGGRGGISFVGVW